MVIFNSYVKLPEGKCGSSNSVRISCQEQVSSASEAAEVEEETPQGYGNQVPGFQLHPIPYYACMNVNKHTLNEQTHK